jgi:hypothetical protein
MKASARIATGEIQAQDSEREQALLRVKKRRDPTGSGA